MKSSTMLPVWGIFLTLCLSFVSGEPGESATQQIVENAAADRIDLTVLSFLDVALSEISTVSGGSTGEPKTSRDIGLRAPASIIDVHAHVVPSWYKTLVPTTGGNPTPNWTLDGHLAFMEAQGIKRSIIAFSAPGPNVFQGQKERTVALARLINEQAAAYCRSYPQRLSFYAVVPFPYTPEAIVEATYAIRTLGAAGIFLQSSTEGVYLGNPQLRPFFDFLNQFGGKQILYIHPSTPYVKSGNNLIEANPTQYPTGNIEFYFETARTLMDLTLTQTIHNFTNINYVIPHVGGAFPSTIDRILKSVPAIYASSMNIYSTRFWWDSAGPTYYHQVAGLLGYGIPKSQLLFGTDYPYAPSFTQAASLAACENSTLLNASDKQNLLTNNAQALFTRISFC